MGELDVAAQLFGHLCGGGGNRLGGEQDLALVFVELRGIIERRIVAARLDIVQYGAHDLARLGGIAARMKGRFLEIVSRHGAVLFVDVGKKRGGHRRHIGDEQRH